MKSRKMRLFALILALGCLMSLAVQATAFGKGNSILEFGTMAPVTGPYVTTTTSSNPIRGINGGGKAWTITSGSGELSASGKLEVSVTGLVLVDTGTNPIPNFRAVVSCQTINDGSPAVTNVVTDPFPATPTGNAHIETQVALPSPCLAPIVFVTSPTGAWFAVTGN